MSLYFNKVYWFVYTIYYVWPTKIKEREGAYIATLLYKHEAFSLHNGGAYLFWC